MADSLTKVARDLIELLGPLCHQHGIHRIKVGDIEVEFNPPRPPQVKIGPKEMEEMSRRFAAGEPTDEELLLHSSPGYVPPELQPQLAQMLKQSMPPPQVARTARRR